MARRLAVAAFLLAASSINAYEHTHDVSPDGDAMWAALTPLCGQSFAGALVEGTEPSDAAFGADGMVMHVRDCSDEEIRIPFQVGENRSRTWVLTRTETGVRLKHIHRHEDGHEDEVSRYGGDTQPGDDGLDLAFYADAYTGEMLPVSARNIWVMTINMEAEEGAYFEYQLLRPHQDRRFRVRFDLTTTVPTPPDNW